MAFDIFDINDNGSLNDEELRLMVTEIYGKKGLSHDLNLIVKKLDKNRDNNISKSEFVGAASKFPALLFPAFHMQVQFSTHPIYRLHHTNLIVHFCHNYLIA